MEHIMEFLKLDISSFIIGIFLIMSGIISMAAVIGKFSELIGKPVGWIRKKNGDHELLISTIQNLSALSSNHEEDMVQIQKELTESIKSIADSNSHRDNQIHALLAAQRESLADRINQKYKHYISIKGIPEDEVEEFTNLHIAYKGVGGNHSGDAKYDYCMNQLPIIPVEVKLLNGN